MLKLVVLKLIGFILIAMLGACESQVPVADVPALIVKPTPASHGELVAIVSKAVGQQSVMVAHDALTLSNLLIIERRSMPNLDGHRDGRRMKEDIDGFRLVMSNSRCILIHTRDESRTVLKETSCREQN